MSMTWNEIMLRRYLEWKEDYPHLVNYWMSVGIAPDDFMWKSQVRCRQTSSN